MKPLLRSLILLIFTALPLRAATNTVRVYYIGNSVTDTVRYGELAELAATRGVKLDWGRTMIPGAPLEWIYTHPNDGFRQEPYGTWTNDLSKVDDFTARWEARYSGGWDNSNETRDYFETLLREVRKETSFLKKKPLLVPVGHVMNALHAEMKAGRVPGYTSIYQFYKDGIHLNEAGSYLVGCTYFATLLKQSPLGLPTAPYGRIDPSLAETIQQTVWQVVTAPPDTGVGAN